MLGRRDSAGEVVRLFAFAIAAGFGAGNASGSSPISSSVSRSSLMSRRKIVAPAKGLLRLCQNAFCANLTWQNPIVRPRGVA